MAQTKPKLLDPLSITVAPLTAYQGIKQKQATGFFYQNGDRYFVVTNLHVLLKEDEDWKANKISIRVHDDPSYLSENFDLEDRKSTRLNSSHPSISYAVFCL